MSSKEAGKSGLDLKWLAIGMVLCVVAGFVVYSFMTARNAARYNACISHLAGIDSAKEQCAMEYDLKDGDMVVRMQCELYLKAGQGYFDCPEDGPGQYIIGAIGQSPRCILHGSLQESRDESRMRMELREKEDS